MLAHIIHNPKRLDRWIHLQYEIQSQGIEYRLWSAQQHKKSAVAIRLAHCQIIQWAKENSQPEVLILEDDVRFCGPGAFQYYLDSKPQDFDLYLGGIHSGGVSKQKTTSYFSGLHCYIIGERFYEAVLGYGGSQQLDYYLARLPGRFCVCYPFAAIQYNGFSDNVKYKVNHDRFLVGRQLFGDFEL